MLRDCSGRAQRRPGDHIRPCCPCSTDRGLASPVRAACRALELRKDRTYDRHSTADLQQPERGCPSPDRLMSQSNIAQRAALPRTHSGNEMIKILQVLELHCHGELQKVDSTGPVLLCVGDKVVLRRAGGAKRCVSPREQFSDSFGALKVRANLLVWLLRAIAVRVRGRCR